MPTPKQNLIIKCCILLSTFSLLAGTAEQPSDSSTDFFLQTHGDFITKNRHCRPIDSTDPNFKRVVQEALQRVPPDEHANLQYMVINLCRFMTKPGKVISFNSSKNKDGNGIFTDTMIRRAIFYIELQDKGYDYLAQFPLEQSTHAHLWCELRSIAEERLKHDCKRHVC